MSDTTTVVLVFLLGVVIMGGCLVACVLIGRHYLRKATKAARYSANVYRHLLRVMQDFERKWDWVNADTEIISRVPPLSTAGQQMRATYAFPDNKTRSEYTRHDDQTRHQADPTSTHDPSAAG